MAEKELDTTLRFKADITDFDAALKEANAATRRANAEFKETTSTMESWGRSSDGLRAKITSLEKVYQAEERKLQALQAEYARVAKEQGENSEAAEKLATALIEQRAKVNKIDTDWKKYRNSLEKVESGAKSAAPDIEKAGDAAEEAGDAARDSAEGWTIAKDVIADFVSNAISSLTDSLLSMAEATREHRTQMGKLATAYEDVGVSAETGKKVFQDFYGVLGDQDQTTEAVSNLVMLTQDQKALSEWTTIATGVYAKFGAALPIENLTEAANETARTGTLTGSLADALNWAGVNEEEFRAKLDKCTTTQQREALIRETLNGLYTKAGEAYRSTNADIIAANEASARMADAMAGVGAVAEPITTVFTNLGASILEKALPAIGAFGEGIQMLLSGDAGGLSAIGEAISGIVVNISQQLPQVLTMGGKIIGELVSGIAQNIPSLAQKGVDALTGLVNGISTYLPIVLEKGREILLNLTQGIAANMPKLIAQALDAIMQFAQSIYDNAPSLIQTGFDVLSNLVTGIMNSLPTLIAKVPEIISTFANTINDNFPTILKKGAELIGQIIKGIISAIPTLIANVPKIITAIVDVWEAFNWLDLGKKALTLLKDGLLKMLGALGNAGKSILTTITNALKNLPQNLLDLGKSAVEGLGKAIGNGWATVKAGAAKIFDGIIDFFKGLPSSIVNVGKDLVKGLWQGISDMAGWVIGKIKGFGDSILNGIKDFFGIHSPSSVMRDEVGKMLGLGVAEGITDSRNTVNNAMRQLEDAVWNNNKPKGSPAAGAAGAGVAGSKTIIINQTNNSPKALSRLEIYRQTHNALSFAGG